MELRGALDAGLHGLGGGDGLGIGGAERGEFVVHERAHAADGLEGGLVAGALGQIDGSGTHDDGCGERQGGLRERLDGERGREAAGENAAQDAREHPHHGDVCHERNPLKQDACHNVGRCLRNKGEEPLLEHETSDAVTAPRGMLGSRVVSQMQLEYHRGLHKYAEGNFWSMNCVESSKLLSAANFVVDGVRAQF